MDAPVIIFPHLGITIKNLESGFYIGNFHIAFYGILIAIGMVLAVVISMKRAKKANQYPDHYIDFGIISILAGVVGARIYYVIFSWSDYKDNLWRIFNIRQGGLAIYGGIIAGFLAAYFVAKYKKMSYLRALDMAAPGIVLAQAIGRWGNFFNKEAYGSFTDSLFAMQIRLDSATGGTQQDVLDHIVNINGTDYIQVHPTFLYESVWCLLIFIGIMLFTKFQKYNGEVLLWYLCAYSLERSIVEGLRTDQLRVGSIAVSQLLSVAIFAGTVAILIINRIRLASGKWQPNFKAVYEDGEPGTYAYYLECKNRKDKKKKSGWETYTVEKESETGAAEAKEAAEEAAEEAETDAAETAETVEAGTEEAAEEAAETDAAETAETVEAGAEEAADAAETIDVAETIDAAEADESADNKEEQ